MSSTFHCARGFLLLATCIIFGCTSLPQQQGIWPWEYGRGSGEPNTGDYIAFRAGIAEFGEPAKVAKPITPESLIRQTPDAPVGIAAPDNKTVQPTECSKESDRIADTGRKPYAFTVGEIRSGSPSLLLQDIADATRGITAFNAGFAPVTVVIDIDRNSSRDVTADKTLPFHAVVPAMTDRTLVRMTPTRNDQHFNLRYSYIWSMGDYTANHLCREGYRYPFKERVRAFAHVTDEMKATPYTRHAVIFFMPKGTPVLAARKGTVIQISGDEKIDILHEDSTIGTYSHLQKVAEDMVAGKTVTTDETIGTAGTAENEMEAYMQLTVWRPEPVRNDALLASAQKTDLVAVSFPLAFSGSESDKGKVLTKSRPVSRSSLPASGKQARGK